MKKIFVLGSGASINTLTPEQKKIISQSEVRLALNKFTVFHKKAGILPNYVYFIDYHNKHAKEFIQRTIDVVKQSDQSQDITFVFHKNVKGRLYPAKTLGFKLQGLNPFNYIHFKRPRLILDYPVNVDFVDVTDFMTLSDWSDSLDKPLFHFRSSLTSALNYISLKFEPAAIYLVGVDLNSSNYFFQSEIEKIQGNKDKKEFIEAEAKTNKHFTALEYKGTSLLDNFHIVTSNLEKRGFKIYSGSESSLLVQDGILEYKSFV